MEDKEDNVVCEHLKSLPESVTPKTPNGCEECLASGDTWVALRLCLTCGHVGCCASSKNRHAQKHFDDTGHPITTPLEERSWKWCYIDNAYVEGAPQSK